MLDDVSFHLRALLDPRVALDPARRVSLVFLLGAAVIAALVLHRRGFALRRIPGRLLSPRLLLHPSARLDYGLIAAKALLRALSLGTLGWSALVVAALVAGWLRRHLGDPPAAGAGALAGAVLTLGVFLAEDASRFFLHRLMHRWPLLWAFHRVHHSAEVLTPLTLYRTHPVEVLLNGARGALSVGAVTGLCAFLFGPALHPATILGVDAVGFVWSLLGANLRHSQVFVSYGRRLEHVLISPAQHQIHHSKDPRHYNRNYGELFALWDWLFGTLYLPSREPERLEFGLAGEDANIHSTLLAAYVVPFTNSARILRGHWRRRLPRATRDVLPR